jgi:hypothetical protein
LSSILAFSADASTAALLTGAAMPSEPFPWNHFWLN